MDHKSLSFRDFLALKVKEQGDRTFIVGADDVPYSWRDIDRASTSLAAKLAAIGIKKRSHVAMCCVNGIEFVTTFFALQKLGAICLVINSSQLAEDIGATAAVGDADHLVYGKLPGMKKDERFTEKMLAEAGLTPDRSYDISVNSMRELMDGYDDAPKLPDITVENDDVAVMIFTSGSTGKPKGVLHSAYNILNSATLSMESQTLVADDRICLILPLFHIFGLVAGLFANAIAASTIYFPKDFRPLTIVDLIDRYKCTIFHCVPTMILAMIQNEDFAPAKVASVRCTIISGAAATPAQIKMFRKAMPQNHFLSAYGLSEMAPISNSAYNDTDEHLLETVGYIASGIRIRIVDPETKKDCPKGKAGEIIVKSESLMTGYYKITADDQALDEEGWIHTGDLGFMREDGYLVLSGRLKELIIRGGENIMPAQVENAISEFDFIDNVKVLGVPSEYYGEEVAACIILTDKAKYDEDVFREALSKKLAKFRMPSYIEIYDSFPLLGTGKIDKVKLKEDLIMRISRNK